MFKSSILIPVILMMCFVVLSCAGISGPARYEPESGGGPMVLMISGQTGPMLYAEFARRLAGSGYLVLLFGGKDLPLDKPDVCRSMIREIIKKKSRSSLGKSEKAAVLGYSLGGAVALSCAAGMAEEVAAIIAYYPATRLIPDLDACVEGFRVPIIVFQGEDDRYLNCCSVEKIREINQAAKEKGRHFELTVYPGAGHGFNLGPLKNKELDAETWQKTIDALQRYLPLPAK